MKKKIITISFIALASIILWISVALSEEYIATVNVPVAFTDLPKNYSIGYSSTDEVYLQLKGSGWELAKLNFLSKELFNVSVHRRVGKHKNDINDFIQANPWLTKSFRVLEMVPNQIEYDVEKAGSKIVPLIKNFKIEFKEGYGPTTAIKIEPQTVEISGPVSLLQKIDSVKTVFKEFVNLSEDLKSEIPIESIEGITFAAKKCSIEFEVQKIVDKTFEELFVETHNVPATKELILYPAKINIVLRGGINNLGRLTNDSIKVFVDYWSALREENRAIEPTIQIPQFTSLVAAKPKTLEYIIKQH